jgi:hypothetical protein
MPRLYHFDVSDETIAVLRHLRRAWRGWSHDGEIFSVELDNGTVSQMRIERAEIEPGLEARWLRADTAAIPVAPVASSFDSGGNDVVIFSSEVWIDEQANVSHGPPGSSPEDAVAVLIVTDAILLENPAGEHMLLRCAVDRMEIVTEIEEIRRFAGMRGYKIEG